MSQGIYFWDGRRYECQPEPTVLGREIFALFFELNQRGFDAWCAENLESVR